MYVYGSIVFLVYETPSRFNPDKGEPARRADNGRFLINMDSKR